MELASSILELSELTASEVRRLSGLTCHGLPLRRGVER